MEKSVMDRVQDHFEEALNYFDSRQIVGVFLQGSQNYGLEIPESDVDTKLIVLPSLDDIVLSRKPVSTTHIRENEEHIDFKDIRNYMRDGFKKQNLNFVEILYTPYFILNPLYQEQWNRLVKNREAISHMNPFKAVKSMKGIALEKYAALEHPYPSKVEIIEKYGYDPKQAHHLFRVEQFIKDYIAGVPYKICMHPNAKFLVDVKLGKYDYAFIREACDKSMEHIIQMADEFCEKTEDKMDVGPVKLLDNVQYEIMKKGLQEEILNNENRYE